MCYTTDGSFITSINLSSNMIVTMSIPLHGHTHSLSLPLFLSQTKCMLETKLWIHFRYYNFVFIRKDLCTCMLLCFWFMLRWTEEIINVLAWGAFNIWYAPIKLCRPKLYLGYTFTLHQVKVYLFWFYYEINIDSKIWFF